MSSSEEDMSLESEMNQFESSEEDFVLESDDTLTGPCSSMKIQELKT